jgi:hypothetical protein
VSCLSRRQDASREKKSFSPTMGIPSGFLMGVSAICVRRRRHVATSCGQFRVRTDLVQCDIFTVQYKLFNFGVNKFISDVNPYNLGVNIVKPPIAARLCVCEREPPAHFAYLVPERIAPSVQCKLQA